MNGLLLASVALLIVNAFVFISPFFGLLTLISFLLSAGWLLGRFIFPRQPYWMQISIGILSIIALMSIIGSVLYYLGPIYPFMLVTMTAFIGAICAIAGRFAPDDEDTTNQSRFKPAALAAFCAILVCLLAWWMAILPHQITESVRTPWEVIPSISIIAIGLAALILYGLAQTKGSSRLVAPAVALMIFSIVAIAFVAYPHGFGFDPFIHRATIAHIAEFGTITPKPLYYIGQYALELSATQVFALPLRTVDNLLIPLLAALMLSTSAAIGFQGILGNQGKTALLALLLAPLGAFIVTTPQSLAYLFTALIVFLSLPRLQNKASVPIVVLLLFAIAALLTHPLAGIPAMIYLVLVVLTTTQRISPIARRILTTLVTILGAIAMPFIFVMQAKISNLPIIFKPGHLFAFDKLGLSGFFDNRYSTWMDGLYLFIPNRMWILIIFSLIGAFFIWRYHGNRRLNLLLVAALMWFANFWILISTLEFAFLIDYERADYAVRLLTVMMIFLLPHVGIALAGIVNHLKDRPQALNLACGIILALMITANTYGTYPRHDNYGRSAGYNVSDNDIDVVYAINDMGGDEDYIVLANQAVSAAALEAFGFKKYYNGDIFYYPIPTGGILYDHYLQMTDIDPTRDRAYAAMDVAEVDLAFFVINDYWWQAEKIREHAKQEADDWFSVGDDAVTVFVFRR
ncbi:MAG: hypothetical protein ABH846_03070 [Patescibacteria group bacterium]